MLLTLIIPAGVLPMTNNVQDCILEHGQDFANLIGDVLSPDDLRNILISLVLRRASRSIYRLCEVLKPPHAANLSGLASGDGNHCKVYATSTATISLIVPLRVQLCK